MANTSWPIGTLDPPGGVQTALAGWQFLDFYFRGVSDGSPDAPWKTPDEAATATGPGGNIAVADGCYEGAITVAKNNLNWHAANPGKVFFKDTQSTVLFPNNNNFTTLNGIVIDNYINVVTNQVTNLTLNNCVVKDTACTVRQNLNVTFETNNCKFINCPEVGAFPLIGQTPNDTWTDVGSTFVGCAIRVTNVVNTKSGNLVMTNTDMDVTSTFDINDDVFAGNRQVTLNNCHFRATIQNLETPANTGTGAWLTENNPLTPQDPLYVGNPSNYEFLIQETSPLIGAGENNSTIGAFKTGVLINTSGLVSNTNIDIGPPITFSGDHVYGAFETQRNIYDQVRKSPSPLFHGIDNGDVSPNSNETQLMPYRNVIDLMWTDTTSGVLQGPRKFLYGYPMFLDDSGNSSGEDNFQVADINDGIQPLNLIDVKEVVYIPEFVKRNRKSLEFNNDTQHGLHTLGVAQTTQDEITLYAVFSLPFIVMDTDFHNLLILTPGGSFLRLFYQRVTDTRISLGLQGNSILSVQVDYVPNERIVATGFQKISTGTFRVCGASQSTPTAQLASTAFVPGSNNMPSYDTIQIGRTPGTPPSAQVKMSKHGVILADAATVFDVNDIFNSGRLSRHVEKNFLANLYADYEYDHPNGTNPVPDIIGSKDMSLNGFVSPTYNDF